MHWKTARFYTHWQEVYGGAKSLEEVIALARIADNHLRRGAKKGDEHPHKRNNWTRNTSGYIGVTYEKARDRWKATLTVKGQSWFEIRKTFDEAVTARQELERRYLNREGA